MRKIKKEKIKTWLVTGASSGVGKELTRQLLEKGYNVIAISRRKPEFIHENVLCLSADVTSIDSIKEVIKQGIQKFKSIDVLSNNAGCSSYLSLEEESEEEMRKVMEVNFWGTYNTCKELLPYFRKQYYGTIVNMSSECGIMPRAFGAAYCSSKFAVEGLTSVLWLETEKFCRVMTVELSYFENTEIGKDKPRGTNYEEYKSVKIVPTKVNRWYFQNDLTLAVKYIIEAVENEKIQRRLMLGRDIISKIRGEVKALNKDINNSYFRAFSCGKIKSNIMGIIIKKIYNLVKFR